MPHHLHPDQARVRLCQRADEIRCAWRTRSLPHWRLVLAPLLALGLIAGIAPGPWRFVAGAFTGVLGSAWVLLHDGRAARLERFRARHDGHHRTMRALRDAGDWVWLSDPADGPPIVLTGPGGVCLLESVCWSGAISIVDGVPVRDFADDPEGTVAMTGVASRMRRLATERRGILAAAGLRVHVRPVLVVWGELETEVVEAAGVTYVRGDAVAGWLTALSTGVRALPVAC